MKPVSKPLTFAPTQAGHRLVTWRKPFMRPAMGAAVLLLLAWLAAPHLRAFLLGGASWTDSTVAQALHGASTPALIAFMQAVSLLHSTAGLLTLAAIGALALWRKGQREAALLAIITLPGGMLLNLAVKTVVQRARPDWGYAYQVVESFSFPSGHTAGATLLYGLLVHGLWRRLRSAGARVALLAAAAAMVLLVGARRIVLGVHFFSDCVAGAMEALVWLGLCLWGTQRLFAPQIEGHLA